MKFYLSFVAIIFFHLVSFSQCASNPILNKKNKFCLSTDSLFVSSANKISKIQWYKNNILDTTIILDSISKVEIVAGGNGFGNGLNQFSIIGSWLLIKRVIFMLLMGAEYYDFHKGLQVQQMALILFRV